MAKHISGLMTKRSVCKDCTSCQTQWTNNENVTNTISTNGLPADNRIPELLYLGTNRGLSMIQKLEKQNTWGECLEKLNELVDAVNEIMTWRFETDDEPAENPTISKMENVEPADNSEKANCQENVQPDIESRSKNVQKEALTMALDKGMEHITGLNNIIESWYKLLQSDKDASTKYAILKSAISAYVENKGGDNE